MGFLFVDNQTYMVMGDSRPVLVLVSELTVKTNNLAYANELIEEAMATGRNEFFYDRYAVANFFPLRNNGKRRIAKMEIGDVLNLVQDGVQVTKVTKRLYAAARVNFEAILCCEEEYSNHDDDEHAVLYVTE